MSRNCCLSASGRSGCVLRLVSRASGDDDGGQVCAALWGVWATDDYAEGFLVRVGMRKELGVRGRGGG